MRSSRTCACFWNSVGGENVRSSRSRSANSAVFWSAMRPILSLPAERRESGADLCHQLGMGNRAPAQEETVVLDRRRRVAVFVGDDREVVVRTGVARIDLHGA